MFFEVYCSLLNLEELRMRSIFRALVVVPIVMTLAGSSAIAGSTDVKSMYLEQAQKPSKPVNIGVKYWIELERNGKKSKVSHRTAFKSNDKIRFHVKPNAECYAYVVMLRGSRGDQSVLFPAKSVTENKLQANKELVVPSQGASLKFDETPGLETLRLVFSRGEIDPKTHLKPESEVSVVLAAKPGTKSVVPEDVKVEIVTAKDEAGDDSQMKNLTLETAATRATDAGEVTVVGSDPNKPLSVDVGLMHM